MEQHGNVARRLIHDKSNRDIITISIATILHDRSTRDVITNSVSSQYANVLCHLGRYLSIILRVMSSNNKINIDEYRKTCTELNVFLITEFPCQVNKHLSGP